MFSLQRLLGKEDKFFNLLEASAEQARHSVQALKELILSTAKNADLDEFVLSQRKGKSVNEEITQALCTTFVTALEREDIEALSTALYKIPKTAGKIAERIMLHPQFVRGFDFTRQLDMLDKATDTVANMLGCLRKGAKLQEIKDVNARLQYLEGEMDKLTLETLRQIYTSQMDGGQVVFLKDLFELLEKVSDRCRDAGNVITHIILKNS